MQNGNTKRPRLLSRFLAVQPIPRDLEQCSRTNSGQVSWLKALRLPPPSRAMAQWLMLLHRGGRLPYHSDEIARDSHPLPFYPPGQRTSPRRQAPAVFYSDERKYSTPHLKKQYLSSPAASSRPSPAPQASGRGRLSAGHRRQHSSPASGGSSRPGRSHPPSYN